MSNYNKYPQSFKQSLGRYDKIRYISFGEDCDTKIGFTVESLKDTHYYGGGVYKSTDQVVLEIVIGEKTYSIPPKLNHIASVIEKSKSILQLEADWDEEDAEIILPETWNGAAVFLINYSKYILENFGIAIKSPEINPCRNGTVDLVWRSKSARFLMNIKKPNSSFFASCYGDLYDNNQPIKDPIQDNKDIIEHLAFWMMKNLS